ncbi:YjbQ family protein [Candidatus Fermentibacteria bacterium]|nr:YjbQ family protein [Candidatus Fermentibacteria bacterium]
MVHGRTLTFQTKGFSDVIDVTDEVNRVVAESGVSEGIACASVIGSTASVTTIEYEPALVEDMQDQLEEMVSQDLESRHSRTWGDDNGFSHLRASILGPGVVLPVTEGKLLLGTWQQIVIVDHDNRSRERRLRVQVVGE